MRRPLNRSLLLSRMLQPQEQHRIASTAWKSEQLRGKGVHCVSQFKGTVHHGGEVRRQEVEAAAHVIATIRKQRPVNAGTQLVFSFFMQSGTWAQEMVLTSFSMDCPTLVYPDKILSHKCVQRLTHPSQVPGGWPPR